MDIDIHTHTTYSDGSDLDVMITAAERAGLTALGLTDHRIVTTDSFGRWARYDLVETYEQRRAVIDGKRETTGLQLYDAAELSYVEADESRIGPFLQATDFAYTIGSVHFAGEYDYTSAAQYIDVDASQYCSTAARYCDAVVALIEFDRFDVLGHLDLPERAPPLRRYTTREEYERVASALVDSGTIPEVNAGRALRSLGRVHPDPAMFDVFSEYGVRFVFGSDSHTGRAIETNPVLRTAVDRHGLRPVAVETVLT